MYADQIKLFAWENLMSGYFRQLQTRFIMKAYLKVQSKLFLHHIIVAHNDFIDTMDYKIFIFSNIITHNNSLHQIVATNVRFVKEEKNL